MEPTQQLASALEQEMFSFFSPNLKPISRKMNDRV